MSDEHRMGIQPPANVPAELLQAEIERLRAEVIRLSGLKTVLELKKLRAECASTGPELQRLRGLIFEHCETEANLRAEFAKLFTACEELAKRVVDGEEEVGRLRKACTNEYTERLKLMGENEELRAELKPWQDIAALLKTQISGPDFLESLQRSALELDWFRRLESKLTKHQWYYDYMEESPKPGAGT